MSVDGRQAPAVDDSALIVGRYRLLEAVGVGGMGVVWRAFDEVLGRTVAVKELVVPPGVDSTQTQEAHLRARREGRIAARLQHPNAVTIFDVVEHDGRPYLVMEFVPHRTLAAVTAGGNALTPRETAQIGARVASALAAAHAAGIVHRDVKPANVLLADDGTVKLTDFGISRAVGDATVTVAGAVFGTPAFLSPEIAQGMQAGFPSDVFSLGATLYAASEGVAPFGDDDNTLAVLHRIANHQIRPLMQAGPLADVLMWMLTYEADRRPTMDQARRALEDVVSAPVTGVGPGTQAVLEAGDGAAAGIAVEAAGDGAAAGVGTVPGPGIEPLPRAQRAAFKTWLVTMVAVALLVVAGLFVALHHGGGSPSAGATGTRSPSSASAARTSAAAKASAATSAAATQPVTASATTQPAAATQPATAPPTTAPVQTSAAGKPADLPTQLSSTITDYYQLVPNQLDQAWNFMTPDYQQNHAGGRSGYNAFWQPIQSVAVTNVVPQPPSTVTATLTYHYKDGHTVVERTAFGLVQVGGVWKIASSSVLG